MKKNKVILSIIVLFLFFIAGVTYYKFNILPQKNNEKDEETINNSRPKQNYTYDINYTNLYSENIIDEIKTSYDFSIEVDKKIINGSIYIDNYKELYILDKDDKSSKLLAEDIYFKTLYMVDTNNLGSMVVYALSEDGEVYMITLVSKNILDTIVRKLTIPGIVKKFTDLKLKQYTDLNYNSVVVYTEDKKMYDVLSGVQYNENILNVFNSYIVYEDGGLSDALGEMLIDSNGEIVKVDDIIIPVMNEKFNFQGKPNIMFITKNKKLTYLYGDAQIYEHKKIVKKVVSNDGILNIIFEDNTSLEINGIYDEFN